MKKIKETEKGFYGCYWPKDGAECAMIAMLGGRLRELYGKISREMSTEKFRTQCADTKSRP